MVNRLLLCLALLATSQLASAHEFSHGALHILHPWARATAPGQPSAALYLTLDNRGTVADTLTKVTTPAARAAALHTMSMQGDVMQMREVASLVVPAESKTAMAPGDGYHIMLTGLRAPLKTGQKFALQLHFKKAGTVPVTVVVEDPQYKP